MNCNAKITYSSLVVSILFASTTFATTWTVDNSLGGMADYDNIQEAIDASSNGDDIVVYPGTYIGNGDNVIDINGKAIWIHSLNGLGSVIINGEGQRRGIMCHSGEGSTTIIEGIEIINGNAPWYDFNGNGTANSWETAGGGMACAGSAPTIINCSFNSNDGNRGGGGMFNYKSSPAISGTTFNYNTLDNDGAGAGMHNRTNCNPSLTNCTFEENTSGDIGGGMYNYDNSSPMLNNCSFISNAVHLYGGAMHNRFMCNPELTLCSFNANHAQNGGGAVMNSSQSAPTFDECSFTFNSCQGDMSEGGAVYNLISNPTFSNCTFTSNAAKNGGALSNALGSELVISNSTISGNTSANGSGAGMSFLYQSSVILTNSSITGNTGAVEGGGIALYDFSSAKLFNCTVEKNSANMRAGGVCAVDNCTLELLGGTTINLNSAPSDADILLRKHTTIDLSNINTAGDVTLLDVGTLMDLSAGHFGVSGSFNAPAYGSIVIDLSNLNVATLTVGNTLTRHGSLGITNNSGSMQSASVGDIISVIEAGTISSNTFDSVVLPAMPSGLGLQLIEQPSGSNTEIALQVIAQEEAQFEDPLAAVLEEEPVDLLAFDMDGDGREELAVLFSGASTARGTGTVKVFSMFGDGTPPQLIASLTTVVGNGASDFDFGDINDDGREDLIVTNANDSTVSILKVVDAVNGTHAFNVSTIAVPGTGQRTPCVALIDWDDDGGKDVIVGVDAIEETLEDAYQVIKDIDLNIRGNGPRFTVPLFELTPGVMVADTPVEVDGIVGGFVGGTSRGSVHKGSSVSVRTLELIAQLDGNGVSSLDVIDVDDNGGDGKVDLLLASEDAKSIYVLPGEDKRAPTFGNLIPFNVGVNVKDVVASDVDGDGDVDFLIAAPEEEDSLIVLRNGGPVAGLLSAGISGRTWGAQSVATSNPVEKVIAGGLDDKDEDDDWLGGGGMSHALNGGLLGNIDQTVIVTNVFCDADFNQDANVDDLDLLSLIAVWGPCEGCEEDLNLDGTVNIRDLLLLIAAWGPCEL